MTLAKHFAFSKGMALDLSAAALDVARENILRHGVGDRVFPVQGNFAAPPVGPKLDLVVSNPPYLSVKELSEISFEVRDFEPEKALVAGPLGQECLEVLSVQVRRLLRPGGRILVEMGYLQGTVARQIFADWNEVLVHKDLAGRDRLVEAVCP